MCPPHEHYGLEIYGQEPASRPNHHPILPRGYALRKEPLLTNLNCVVKSKGYLVFSGQIARSSGAADYPVITGLALGVVEAALGRGGVGGGVGVVGNNQVVVSQVLEPAGEQVLLLRPQGRALLLLHDGAETLHDGSCLVLVGQIPRENVPVGGLRRVVPAVTLQGLPDSRLGDAIGVGDLPLRPSLLAEAPQCGAVW